MKYIDLTQTFTSSMPVFPGDPHSRLEKIMKSEGSDEEIIVDHLLSTNMHVGTHIDAPMHMVAGGKKISEFGPDAFCGRGVLIDVRGAHQIDHALIEKAKIQKGDIVLFMTGHDKHFGTPAYFENYPLLTEAAGKILVEQGVKIVGFDSASPDAAPYPVHRILLKSEVLIIENLTNLGALQNALAFEVIALPLKLEADASPARVIATATFS